MHSKKSLLSITFSALMISTAQAGIVTTTVQGTLGNWKAWDNLGKFDFGSTYTEAVNGHDLNQSNEYGLHDPAGNPPFSLTVSGTIQYNSETRQITALSLQQQGTAYAGFAYANADYPYSYYVWDKLTFSNLAWTLNASNGYLSQTAGQATGCNNQDPAIYCLGIRDGLNTNTHTNNLYQQSIFDFQGVNAGFRTLPRSNSADSDYGTHHYKTWTQTAGVTGLIVNANGSIVLNVASRINSNQALLNYANLANFTLQAEPVPIPASAWLLGSGLIGLGSIARRKK